MATEISIGMDNSVGAEPTPPSPLDVAIDLELEQPVAPTPEPPEPPAVEFTQSFENHPDAQLLRETFETVSQNLRDFFSTLEYSNGKLVRKIYTNSTRTIVKTFNYSGTRLTSIVLSGDTPYGIALTKTLGYTGNNLTSVGYS